MEFRVLILCFAFFQVAISQYYSVPPSSYFSGYNYCPSTPAYSPATPNQPRSLQPLALSKCLKRIGSEKSCVKCSPKTASAYFLTTPPEKATANIGIDKGVVKGPTYSCALCNNFADVPPSSKIQPPPPIGLKVLSETIDKVSTIGIPKLKPKTSFSDMYERHKVSKKMNFDEELLEGFLTGLGIAL